MTQATNAVYTDISAAQLVEQAIKRGEGELAANGAFVVRTGHRSGPSPVDRSSVQEQGSQGNIACCPINCPLPPDKFDALCDRVETFILAPDHFASPDHVGSSD